MAAMVAMGSSSINGSVSTQVSSSVSVQEKGSRNKRKFRVDPPLGDPIKLPSSTQINYPSFDFSAEKSQNTQGHDQHGVCELCTLNNDLPNTFKPDLRQFCGLGSIEVGPKEELETGEFEDADWSDLNETQLEELLLSNLDAIFRSAVKQIVACGYSEEVARKAVLRSGICYGCKDTVSNIVENTLAFLRNRQENDTSREHFESLEQLEKYLLAEMVCVLREVRPFFSIGDAMWWLLICDMNVSHACVMDGDPLSSFGNDKTQESSFSLPNLSKLELEANSCEPNLPNLSKPDPLFPWPHSAQAEIPDKEGIPNLHGTRTPPVLEGLPPEKVGPIPTFNNLENSFTVKGEHNQATHHSSALEEKSGVGRKGHSSTVKRESILRRKSLHREKSNRAYASKSALRLGKLDNLGGLILDKKQKSVLDYTDADLKSASSKLSKAAGVDMSQTDGNNNARVSKPMEFNLKTVDASSSLPAINTELSLSLPSKSKTASKPPGSDFEASNYRFTGIQYEKTLEQWVQDDKDEMILKLTPKVQELQNLLQDWTEWANQKVMQAARRLSKDKAELKTLRQEKEEVIRLKAEKQSLEENSMRKLSEMENALCKTKGQIEHANSAVCRLEVENSELRKQMEEAKLQAAESAASCQEVSRREKRTLMKFHSWEKQKTLFQGELVTEKRKLALLQREFEQAKDFQHQLAARWKQEENAKEEQLMQANSIRKEREQIEASAKLKEDVIRLKAENDLQRYKDDIQKLEIEISQLRLKSDSPKIAALWWGIDGSYASCLTDGKGYPAIKGTKQIPYISEMVENFQDSVRTRDMKRERECVMCLTEEMSVVFLPCAHQVVCTKCNELHEKQGMKDCPSCRTPIQRRVCVRYAHS